MSWHIEGCTGACLACLIEETVLEHYGTQGLDFLRRKVGASETEHQWICPRCKVDRFKEDCKGDRATCPMVATAHNVELRGTEPIGEASLSNEGFGVSADTEKGD